MNFIESAQSTQVTLSRLQEFRSGQAKTVPIATAKARGKQKLLAKAKSMIVA
ncbi:hypothetical protein NKT77_08980 [Moraxella sp. FZLJ2107]|uniref:hypothetical protein n=1 Tax=unclassified Moraxella TaxID=2685852 RepID=UPI00209C093E|nr:MULTISPECIES: hypothetical protein [unclassified Moraxella]USZ15545.1 hypothetical protein NGM44_04025 [Moraxella sp. FZFQ2102]UTO04634.1 hypothetical protein NKT77_08980 [Moraxella sp. FZLJ2107]UTO21362.1 hypothetical protein NKU06_05765 [Moraxella sp. FZLJ2109]